MIKLPADTAKGFPDLLVWAALVESGIILNKNGSFTAGWRYIGPSHETAGAAEHNLLSARVNNTFAQLGSEWMIHVDANRLPARAYPDESESYFPDRATQLIEAERRMQFQAEGAHFITQFTLIVTYLPASITQNKSAALLFNTQAAPASLADQALASFKAGLEELEDRLSGSFKLERLGQQAMPTGGSTDSLINHCRFVLTHQLETIRTPLVPMYLDHLIGNCELYTGLTPKLDERYIAVIAITGFPSESLPSMLSVLAHMPVTSRWSTRFICQDAAAAQSTLKAHRRKWHQRVRGFWDQVLNNQPTASSLIDQDASAMVDETEAAIAEVSSGQVGYGYYTSVVILQDHSADAVQQAARMTRRLILNLGFVARIETVNTLEAYLGSLPGHVAENIRRPLLHTAHLANLLPLSSVYAGAEHAPCPFYPPDSPPLLHATTAGTTPFRLNLHVGDVGHTLIFGPTGAGKSTLLALLAAQFRRYRGASVIAFDKGRSLEVLTLATGGRHYDVGGDSGPCFAPLSQLENTGELAWTAEWIETLVQLQGVLLSPKQRTELMRALQALINKPNRTLTMLQIELQDMVLKDALSNYTLTGPYGEMLDAVGDGIQLAQFSCIEINELMGRNDKIRLPVLTYLFRQVERQAKGQPCLVILDEAWIMLAHEVFQAKIKEWLKTLRKANVSVVLATQSLSDAIESGILNILIESCLTKIFLANPDAQHPDAAHQYRQLGLIQEELAIIAEMTPKREYYVRGKGNQIIDLRLGDLTLSLVGSSSPDDLIMARQLAAHSKNKFIDSWINYKKIDIRSLSN